METKILARFIAVIPDGQGARKKKTIVLLDKDSTGRYYFATVSVKEGKPDGAPNKLFWVNDNQLPVYFTDSERGDKFIESMGTTIHKSHYSDFTALFKLLYTNVRFEDVYSRTKLGAPSQNDASKKLLEDAVRNWFTERVGGTDEEPVLRTSLLNLNAISRQSGVNQGNLRSFTLGDKGLSGESMYALLPVLEKLGFKSNP
ncbi:hypothetical protein GCM10028807_62730 [Spirosoma daeguense]